MTIIEQSELNSQYDQALARARAHIANGTDYSSQEWAAEVERARIAGLPGNACWSYRTPSPLSLDQVNANDRLGQSLRDESKILNHALAMLNKELNPDFTSEYAPYHVMPAFQQGMADYAASRRAELSGVAGQAYDRGLECAMRTARANR